MEPWNIVEWKSNISIFPGLFRYLGNFSKFYKFRLIFWESKSWLLNWYWSISVWGKCFRTLEYSIMKVPFPNITRIVLILEKFFQIIVTFIKEFLCFLVTETSLVVFQRYWDVSSWTGCFGSLRYSKMEVIFPNISFYPVLLFVFSRLGWFSQHTSNIFWV